MMECVTLKIKKKKGLLLLSVKMINWSFNVDGREVCLSANICDDNDSVLWHKRLSHFELCNLKTDG